jgi:hypothetical protein
MDDLDRSTNAVVMSARAEPSPARKSSRASRAKANVPGARSMEPSVAATGPQDWRARLKAAEPALERLLACGYGLMLLLFFLIRDHDFLRHWSYVAVMAPFLLLVRREEWRVLVRSPIIVASAVYLAWLWASVWWSAGASTMDAVLLARDAIAILAFLGSTVLLARRRPTYFPHLLRALCWVAGVAAVISLGWYYVAGSVNDRAWGIGIDGYPTMAAMVYGVAFFVALYGGLRQANTNGERLAYIAVLTTTLAFIVAAEARGPMVALAGTVLLVGLLMRQKALVIGLPLVIVAYLVLHFSGAIETYDLISRGMTERDVLWDRALERSEAAPWLGYGIADPQTFPITSEQAPVPDRQGKCVWPECTHPHNLLLSHQVTGGLPAVALLLVLLSLWLSTSIRLIRRDRDYLLFALLVFVVVCGLVELRVFLKPLDIAWLYFWLPVGLVAAASMSDRSPGHGV